MRKLNRQRKVFQALNKDGREPLFAELKAPYAKAEAASALSVQIGAASIHVPQGADRSTVSMLVDVLLERC